MTPQSPTTKRRGLPWFPILVLTMTILGVAYVQSLPEFERNLKSWLTAGLPLLAGLLLVMWFLLIPFGNIRYMRRFI